jgi:exonuclease VII large subunit
LGEEIANIVAQWDQRYLRVPAQKVLTATEAILDEAAEYVAERRRTMILAVRDRLRAEERQLVATRQRLWLQGTHLLDSASQMLTSTRQLLSAYDPKRRLAQGWSIVTGADGSVVRRLADVRLGEVVRVMVSDGSFESTVNEKNGKSA